jgi:hypothetical protein
MSGGLGLGRGGRELLGLLGQPDRLQRRLRVGFELLGEARVLAIRSMILSLSALSRCPNALGSIAMAIAPSLAESSSPLAIARVAGRSGS